VRRNSSQRNSEQGFAAIDALVALIILASTLILSLGAIHTARIGAANAAEMRRADNALQGLLRTTPLAIGEVSGRTADFDWWVSTAPSALDVHWPTARICIRAASVRALASGRRYALTTAQICPAPKA
jgi:hypothetical protein